MRVQSTAVNSIKIGGAAGFLTVTSILVFAIIIPSAVAGNRVSGTTDASAILAYYNHPALVWAFWASGIGVLFTLVFIYGLYLALKSKAASSGLTVILLAPVAMAVIEMSLLLVQWALQGTLVWVAGSQAVAADAATRTTLAALAVGIFRFWDLLYNSLLYWLEGGFLLLFSLVILKTRGLSRGIGGLGIVAAAYQFFNSLAIPLGVPDTLTLPGNLLLVAWFLTASYSLFRFKMD